MPLVAPAAGSAPLRETASSVSLLRELGCLMMTNDAPVKQSSQKDIDSAWRYHQSADTLFHSRLTSFVTSQSFLITGYMVSFYIPKEFPNWYALCVRLSVGTLAIGYSVAFYRVSNWLYLGMQELKREYLAGSSANDPIGDPIYKRYFFHRRTSQGVRGEDKIGEIIPRFLPWLTFAFWFWLLFLELWRITRP
jgi:hypothetical protein